MELREKKKIAAKMLKESVKIPRIEVFNLREGEEKRVFPEIDTYIREAKRLYREIIEDIRERSAVDIEALRNYEHYLTIQNGRLISKPIEGRKIIQIGEHIRHYITYQTLLYIEGGQVYYAITLPNTKKLIASTNENIRAISTWSILADRETIDRIETYGNRLENLAHISKPETTIKIARFKGILSKIRVSITDRIRMEIVELLRLNGAMLRFYVEGRNLWLKNENGAIYASTDGEKFHRINKKKIEELTHKYYLGDIAEGILDIIFLVDWKRRTKRDKDTTNKKEEEELTPKELRGVYGSLWITIFSKRKEITIKPFKMEGKRTKKYGIYIRYKNNFIPLTEGRKASEILEMWKRGIRQLRSNTIIIKNVRDILPIAVHFMRTEEALTRINEIIEELEVVINEGMGKD